MDIFDSTYLYPLGIILVVAVLVFIAILLAKFYVVSQDFLNALAILKGRGDDIWVELSMIRDNTKNGHVELPLPEPTPAPAPVAPLYVSDKPKPPKKKPDSKRRIIPKLVNKLTGKEPAKVRKPVWDKQEGG